jgi:hypothetical protein
MSHKKHINFFVAFIPQNTKSFLEAKKSTEGRKGFEPLNQLKKKKEAKTHKREKWFARLKRWEKSRPYSITPQRGAQRLLFAEPDTCLEHDQNVALILPLLGARTCRPSSHEAARRNNNVFTTASHRLGIQDLLRSKKRGSEENLTQKKKKKLKKKVPNPIHSSQKRKTHAHASQQHSAAQKTRTDQATQSRKEKKKKKKKKKKKHFKKKPHLLPVC